MSWNELSLKDKADYIKESVNNGIYNLSDIRNRYNMYAEGGYKPSESIKKRIINWEGSSMRTNRSFQAEADDFNRVIPSSIRSKLSQQQLDALYSYGYNVGMGNLKKRVLPTLINYVQGKASNEDVQKSMWASKDNELRGLTTRRNTERSLFGGNYQTVFTGTGDTPHNYGYIANRSSSNPYQIQNEEWQSKNYLDAYKGLQLSMNDIMGKTKEDDIDDLFSTGTGPTISMENLLSIGNNNTIAPVQPDYSYAKSLLSDFDSNLNSNIFDEGGNLSYIDVNNRRNNLSDGGNTYKNGGTLNKPRFRHVKNYGVTDTTPYPNDEDKPNISTTRLNPFESLAKFTSRNLMELGRSGLLDTEGLNVAQDSYLVPTKAIQAKMFADAGYTRDYNAEKNRNYGLVKKGVGNRNIPIYSRTNPSFGKQRKDLVVLGNSYNIDNVNKALVHAGSYPSAIYSDNEGNIYINSWDLNDYGADAAGNTGDLNDHYGSFRKKLAKAVDVVGNPTVVTTGYQRALDNNKPIKISNYSDYYNLSNNRNNEAIKEALDNWMTKQGVELNEVGYGSPLVEIIGKRKYSLGGRCKLRNGGLISKRRNYFSDGGFKAKYGTTVPYKRIHINEDGTFTDILTGKVYNTSATNGEDVVITGKANHWKEAGKKDTSSYFDPMGAVNFINAAIAPISNFMPSNIVGSIREARDYNTFMNSFMNQDNTGFFTREYAKEHPYISNAGNFLGDLALFSFPYNKTSKINNIESLGRTVKSLTPSNKLETIDAALATGIGTIPGDMLIADSYNRTKGGKKATFIDNLEFYGGMGLSTLGAVLGHDFSVEAFNLGKSAIGRTTYDVLFKPTQTLQAAKNGLYHINKEVTANKVGQAFIDGVYSGFDDYYKNYANSTQQYFMEGKYPGININTRNPNDRKIIVKLYPEEDELNEYAYFSDKFISPSGLDEYVTFATKSPTTNLPMMPSLKYYKGNGAHESLHGQLNNTIGLNPLSKYDVEAKYFRGNPDIGIDFSSWENEASTNWSKSIEELEAEFFNYKAKNNLEGKFKDLTKAQQQEFIDLASKRFKVSKNGIRNGMSILNKYFDTVMPKVK